MTILCRKGLFEASITGGLLTVFRKHQPLFICRLSKQPCLVMRSDGLYTQNSPEALMPLYCGDDTGQLMSCLTDALQSHERRTVGRRRLTALVVAMMLTAAAWITLSPPAGLVPSGSISPASSVPINTPAMNEVTVRDHNVTSPVQAARAAVSQGTITGNTAAPPPADGWTLPLNVRAELPGKLHNAASRGLFTVPLSSGHARTLYVFADPECSNCRRMERHIETAAGSVNVVIFPVTIEGQQSSLNALTPVMMLPEAKRAAAWKQLFAADAGVSVPGAQAASSAVADQTQAEMARGAIGVNEVAFRAYRLPGTPWTISDDGRYVPQGVLSSPAALEAFLNGGQHDGQ